MDWKDIATVELPIGAQIGDLTGVVDQLEQQVKAALGPRATQPEAPHVKALAPPVEDAFEALLAARDALVAAERKRPAVPSGAPGGRDTSAANTSADDAWRAFEKFLDAARSLDDDLVPGRAEAEPLHARLFATDGLRFINYRPRRQWDAAQRLVAILHEPAVGDTVDGLGGGRFLKAVARAHKEFGLAFGFSQAQPTDQSVTSTRAEQLVLQGALRDYLLKVAAQVSARRPESGVLARFLLQPYASLVDDLARAPRPAKAVTPADDPSPKPVPSPA